MEYTVFVTHFSKKQWQASVPGLPDCVVEAPSRTEAIEKLRTRIQEVAENTEVFRIEVPVAPSLVEHSSPSLQMHTPWQWFGIFKDDPTLAQLFDSIEIARDAGILEG